MDPRNKPQNKRFEGPATWQPYKNVGGKIVENKKFLEYYGGATMKNPDFNKDPDMAAWAMRKYPTPQKPKA